MTFEMTHLYVSPYFIVGLSLYLVPFHAFIAICRAHCVENIESEALKSELKSFPCHAAYTMQEHCV